MGQTAWMGIRILTLFGGLILLPLTAMVGLGGNNPATFWIGEAFWGVKFASAREPSEPVEREELVLSSSAKNYIIDQNTQDYSQISSYLADSRPTPSSPPYFWRKTAKDPIRPLPSIEGARPTPFPHLGGDAEFLPPQSPKGANPSTLSETILAPFQAPASSCSSGTIPEKEDICLSANSAPFSKVVGPCQKDCQHFGRYLEQLGAVDYSVQCWGPQPGMYRASCRVRVLGCGSLWTRHFEATSASASQAMADLVDQVVRWRHRMLVGF